MKLLQWIKSLLTGEMTVPAREYIRDTVMKSIPAPPFVTTGKRTSAEYPKWKQLIPENPTKEQFRKAWRIIFGHWPEECFIYNVYGSTSNTGFGVRTPTGSHHHGGFGYHTENPSIPGGEHFYYTGCGCTWSSDSKGIRYYLIDIDTGLPVHWDEVLSLEIVRKYVYNLRMNSDKPIDHLLNRLALDEHSTD